MLPEILVRIEQFTKLVEQYLGQHMIMARVLKDFGDFMLEKQLFGEAETWYSKSNAIYNMAEHDHDRIAMEYSMLLQNWGATKCYLGHYQAGLEKFETSLAILKTRSESSKNCYKAYSRLSKIFYELHVEHGHTAWEIAAKSSLMDEPRFRKEMENLLGTSLVDAFQKGVKKEVTGHVLFRRSMCYQRERCRRPSCNFAHNEKELRN